MEEVHVAVIIPAFNEAKSVGDVVQSVPRKIDGASKVTIIVIDDGSTDNTRKAALDAGADKVISFKYNRGLAAVFQKGLDTALELGADVLVNIDADGQYDASEIPALIKPIVAGEADVVLTDRRIWSLSHMPLSKKVGNTLATWVTRMASGYPVLDGQSGFRAFSREAALRIMVFSNYTYVAETVIQAYYKKLRIVQMPCVFRERHGESRLVKNVFFYAMRAGLTILRTYLVYKPLKTFTILGGSVFFLGMLAGIRVLANYMEYGAVSPHIPMAILTATLLIVGFQIIVMGLLADLMSVNRKLVEDIGYRIRNR